jgi:hypothetical protein
MTKMEKNWNISSNTENCLVGRCQDFHMIPCDSRHYCGNQQPGLKRIAVSLKKCNFWLKNTIHYK